MSYYFLKLFFSLGVTKPEIFTISPFDCIRSKVIALDCLFFFPLELNLLQFLPIKFDLPLAK